MKTLVLVISCVCASIGSTLAGDLLDSVLSATPDSATNSNARTEDVLPAPADGGAMSDVRVAAAQLSAPVQATVAQSVPESGTVQSAASPRKTGRGGCMGGCIGCCLGLRAAADYNEGMRLSIREKLRFIPYVKDIISLFDAFDGYHGVSRTQLHAALPAYY